MAVNLSGSAFQPAGTMKTQGKLILLSANVNNGSH